MHNKYKYSMKPMFEDRLKVLLPEENDFKAFSEIIHHQPKNFIRCNTLKITPEKLMKRLSKKWKVEQPHKSNPEIILITQELLPGELGNSIEHVLGYYYVQEVCSMMSIIALNPEENEFILDLCASPGSKTTQMAMAMNNKGTIIANDLKMDRIAILAANLEKNGVSNAVITRNDGIDLCNKFKENHFEFDKILLDAPCSGEGTLRSSPKTFLMWNEKVVNNLGRQQKKLIANALKILKKDGILVYSTCTHAPEENESVIQFALDNFPVKIEQIQLPLKTRPGITEWKNGKFSQELKKAHRIYPQDNDSEGFFVCKLRLMEKIE